MKHGTVALAVLASLAVCTNAIAQESEAPTEDAWNGSPVTRKAAQQAKEETAEEEAEEKSEDEGEEETAPDTVVLTPEQVQIKRLEARLASLEAQPRRVVYAAPRRGTPGINSGVVVGVGAAVLTVTTLFAIRPHRGKPQEAALSNIRPNVAFGSLIGGSAALGVLGAGLELKNGWVVSVGALGTVAALLRPVVFRSQALEQFDARNQVR